MWCKSRIHRFSFIKRRLGHPYPPSEKLGIRIVDRYDVIVILRAKRIVRWMATPLDRMMTSLFLSYAGTQWGMCPSAYHVARERCD
jgi:hypothetical protein